jgi:hypothetical protein
MLFRRVAILCAVVTVGLLAMASWRFPGGKISLSILGGSVIGLANFFLLGRVVAALVGRGSYGKMRLTALFFLKLAALAAIFGIILAAPVDIIAFAVGLGAVVVAIIIAGFIPYGRTF